MHSHCSLLHEAPLELKSILQSEKAARGEAEQLLLTFGREDNVPFMDDLASALAGLLHLQGRAHALLRLAQPLTLLVAHFGHDLGHHGAPSAKHQLQSAAHSSRHFKATHPNENPDEPGSPSA